MHYETTYTLENFILNTQWKDVPQEVRDRMRGCFLDLMCALVIGSRSRQFQAGLKLAESVFPPGDIPVIGSSKTFSLLGAAAAMGHASNAYDIDDSHSLTRSHPGTAVVGGILAAAYQYDLTLEQFLNIMLVAYETTLRSGAAIMDYYNFAHSSGTFGAVGVAAGVGRILGFTKEQMNNVLSIAEFNAPIVPGIRSVEYPSMNKDGVPFGVMTGLLAVYDALCGFEGNKNLLEADEYRHYLDDLGEKWEVMDLNFKPYTCCRWAHPAIDACIDLMRDNNLSSDDIDSVNIYTFFKATQLSKIIPKTTDEAQYNIAYPVAAAIVHGDCSLAQIREKNLHDPRVINMMDRLAFLVDDRYEAAFPADRYSRAEIMTKDGRKFVSGDRQPRGEALENIGMDWLAAKFRRITGSILSSEGQESIIRMISSEKDIPIRTIIDETNRSDFWLDV